MFVDACHNVGLWGRLQIETISATGTLLLCLLSLLLALRLVSLFQSAPALLNFTHTRCCRTTLCSPSMIWGCLEWVGPRLACRPSGSQVMQMSSPPARHLLTSTGRIVGAITSTFRYVRGPTTACTACFPSLLLQLKNIQDFRIHQNG